MGPVFQRQSLMGANSTVQPLQAAPAWQHRIPETDVIMEFALVSTDVNVEFEVTSGSEVLVQRGPVSGGGTIGVFPVFDNVKKSIVAFANREIAINLFEVAGGTPSVMLEVALTPI